MGEIVTICLGQCGTQIGCKYWEVICDEHGILPNGMYCGDSDMQLEKINLLYIESSVGRYVPRSVLIDLEPSVLEAIRSSEFGELHRPDNFIFGKTGAGNNWAKGRHTEGAEMLETSIEAIRKEVEACSRIQAIQITHSIGGGCGSGMGSLVLDEIKLDYPKLTVATYSVFPSSNASETVVEPYNSILSIPALVDVSHLTFCFDNDSLHKICHEILKISTPTYSDMNHLVAMVMATASCCSRFPGNVPIYTYQNLIDDVVAVHPLHFVVPGFVPLSSRGVLPYRTMDMLDLLQQMFDPKILMTKCDPTIGKYMRVASIFRGHHPWNSVEEGLRKLKILSKPYFVGDISKGFCDLPPRGYKTAAAIVGNTTSVMSLFGRLRKSFAAMMKRRAYLHWYFGEGMHQQDFIDAENVVSNLVTHYQKIELDLSNKEQVPSKLEDDSGSPCTI